MIIEILHCLKDPKLWELWYVPYYDDINPAVPLGTLSYGNYGIFLIMGNAGFIPSTVVPESPVIVKATGSHTREGSRSRTPIWGIGLRVSWEPMLLKGSFIGILLKDLLPKPCKPYNLLSSLNPCRSR